MKVVIDSKIDPNQCECEKCGRVAYTPICLWTPENEDHVLGWCKDVGWNICYFDMTEKKWYWHNDYVATDIEFIAPLPPSPM